ncbi:MAG: hypothetical protein ACD_63C00055G0001 [uncultured bacterium]|uniref:Addiction module toxin RelE n=1 Tax=Candidatus Terrybacteria bacterium RIFCSPLOWO2_01_FULL_58_14 TaxID=1802369 RepID=A0A1G2Q0Q2_9BACT|nr:MAG: hypothetical protein ACD_63C00055G0001 [uncultured bacterium]OHA54145.1 MAG: hypothetical protein A2991_02625 [Candidatus Terrybacteria bacterium RIFCSPLOWO2_01_FULL_58_14]
MYEAIFYDDPETGREPVREYLKGLGDRISGYIYGILLHIESNGQLPGFPLASHVEGAIWELRFHKQGIYPRILYATVVGARLILLEGFTKTTRETPDKHKKAAKNRLAEFLKRSENQKSLAKESKRHGKSKKKK